MKLQLATLTLSLRYIPNHVANAQTCSGVTGPFQLTEITGTCNYETLLEEYTRQVFDMTGSTCQAGSTLTAKEDLDAKLTTATGAASGEEAAEIICKAMYDNADVTAFVEAAGKSEDPTNLHFEQEFYNGGGEWQEEVETLYETADRSATSVLREDAARVREFYVGLGSYSRVEWPNSLTNFEDSTCTSNAAMCCWPKDRQANDGNGNCATPYDVNCVDKDPADNTNLCFADFSKGDASTNLNSSNGFAVFPEDNNNGEGAIHCHGFAWADDEYDPISRYKANNLFFVSMYDHMHQRGYVKNIPGMPMCGCMEQMPIATRSDCTQVDVTEDWEVTFDGTSFTTKMVKVEVDFNACQGRNNNNNNLWAYAARLYDEGRMTAAQFGKVGRVLTNDHDCYHATEYAKQQNGYMTAYTHDDQMYTKVAGRDNMFAGEPYGREAFNKAFFEQSLTKPSAIDIPEGQTYGERETPIILRICPDCTKTHRKIWYRRLTPVRNPEFDLLHSILFHRSGNPQAGNVWNVDFTLHSSYEDAETGANPWECPNNSFNYWSPFTGECSPDGTKVRDQYTVWNWFPGPRPNVAYYINKPEATGVKDYMDYNTSIDSAADDLTDIDIGPVQKAGNTWEDGGVFHMTGAGNDIWGHKDQFHYKSQKWAGDIDVSVRITHLANNGQDAWAKAGIMLRSDNSEDATNSFVLLSGTEGITLLGRRSKGKHAHHVDAARLDTNQKNAWLRLVKKQETIEFYRGTNDGTADTPGDWILQGTDTILFPDDMYRVGFAITSHRGDYLSEATFDNYVIQNYDFPTSAPSLSSAPTPWQPLINIGEPQRDGEFTTSQDGLIDYVKGSGTGIWGTADSFAFYNHQIQMSKVPLEVTMYIKHFDNSNIYARGGLMIRDNNDEDAANAFVGAAGNDQGAVFQSRGSAGASTDHHKMIYANWNNAMWVKMTLDGAGVVTGYYKLEEADEWIMLGSTQLTLTGSTIQVGRAITSGTDYEWALHTVETQNYEVVTNTV